eukprot:3691881-Prymnesium_polylepis.1
MNAVFRWKVAVERAPESEEKDAAVASADRADVSMGTKLWARGRVSQHVWGARALPRVTG